MAGAKSVLVLNAGLEELHRVTVKHAITMLAREVAEVYEAVEGKSFGPHPWPKVLKLVRYVRMGWRARRGPACTKAGVKQRDGHRCAYCGGRADTVDHIVPESRGGKLSWLNCVAACRRCNNLKGDRTPVEWGRRLLFEPSVPSWPSYHMVDVDLAVAVA